MQPIYRRSLLSLIAQMALAVWVGTANADEPSEPWMCPASTAPEAEAINNFTVTIAGGLSLGNYEAGMNWALLEARKRGASSQAQAPRTHNLKAASGASAGAINALLSALAWCEIDLDSTVEKNLFHDVWLPVGLDTMFPRDLSAYEDDDLLMSRLVSHQRAQKIIEQFIENHHFRNDCGPIELAVAVTGQRSITVRRGSLKAPSNYYFIPITMTVENQQPVFVSNYDAVRANDNAIALAKEGEPLARARVFEAMMASSAFPIAFGPVELPYAQIGNEVCTDPKGCKMLFSDGGVFDNVPLRLAMQLAEGARENIYFDPEVRRHEVHSCKPKKSQPRKDEEEEIAPIARTLEIYSRALGSARKRILFETLTQMDAARRPELPSRFAPLTGDLISGFGAWLDEGFRQYDYLAGVYDGLVYVASTETSADAKRISIEGWLDRLAIAGEHRAQLLTFQQLENHWLPTAEHRQAVMVLLSARASSTASEKDRVAMVRKVMFEHHLRAGRKARNPGGFCDDELDMSALVKGLADNKYAFSSESGEFLYASQTRPELWWASLLARAMRRLDDVNEDHFLRDLGGVMDAVTYSYDPQRLFAWKLGMQQRLWLDTTEYQVLGGMAYITGSGERQTRIGATLSLPASNHEFEPRLGGHLGQDLSLNLFSSVWFQAGADYGLESERWRLGIGFGLQLIDLVRMGFAFHGWVGDIDQAWENKWGTQIQPSIVLGLNLDTVVALVL